MLCDVILITQILFDLLNFLSCNHVRDAYQYSLMKRLFINITMATATTCYGLFFHYLGLPQEDRLATTRSFQSQFAAYKKANQMFADVVNKHYEEGDVVWCHDYHLMFLPKCLKEYNSNMKVGWFLHTPFPSSEIHRTLPSRSELLRSVLAADLVG